MPNATRAARPGGSHQNAPTPRHDPDGSEPGGRFQPTRANVGNRVQFECPICGSSDANAAVILDRDGDPRTLIGCFALNCPVEKRAPYLRALGLAWGLTDGETRERLAAEAYRRSARPKRRAKPESPPSVALVEGWAARLWTEPAALAYLRSERGLTDATIRASRIGYAASGSGRTWSEFGAFTIPVVRRRTVLTMRRRFWPDLPRSTKGKPVKIAGPAGVPMALYPDAPTGRTLIVCEGEFDALLLRQKRLPAVTSTAGTAWDQSWNRVVVGCRVAVIYDAGEASLAKARKLAEAFRAAGAETAWAVDLGAAGLDDGEDVTDWFVTYGRSREDLRRLIADERRPR